MKKLVFAVSCLATFSLLALEKPATVPEVTRWESGNGVLKLPADVKRIVETKLDKAAKDLGTEGYTMDIGPRKIRITAATQTGLFYAAQTLKQMVKTSGGNLPQGKITDVPKYRVRGFVFDVGRLPVPIEFLYEVVDIMASYKMNDLQLHLNDNYIWHEDYVKQGKDPFKESYAAFRLESKLKGLTAKDISYTKKDFMELVAYAKKKTAVAISGRALFPKKDEYDVRTSRISPPAANDERISASVPTVSSIEKAVAEQRSIVSTNTSRTPRSPWSRGETTEDEA